MKKRWISLVLAFVFLLSLCAGNNSFWYRPSDGTPVSTFPNLGSGPDDPPNPSGGWEIPGGGEWVVFSIEGKIIMPGSSGIHGKTGSNAIGKIGEDYPVKMSGSAYVAPEDLWIGPGADPYNVVYVPGTYPPYGSEYRERTNNLSETLSFPLPDWLNFSFPDVPEGLPEKDNIDAGWSPPPGGFVIPPDGSGHYDSIRVQNELTVQVGDNDLVLDIDSLEIPNNGKFQVERNGTGRLFLFVNDSFSLTGSSKISGDAEDGDFI
ncbi:MAG TPA: hypothetical protein PLF96_14130, partial [Thermotogota bacterium]|nr:hypothetical protein [Thermotogota bacterium]